MLSACKEWEQFALRLVSDSCIVTPDDVENLSGESNFLMTFADTIQQTSFLGDLSSYLKRFLLPFSKRGCHCVVHPLPTIIIAFT